MQQVSNTRVDGHSGRSKNAPRERLGPHVMVCMHTQTHHNNKQVIAVEFTCVTGKSSTCSTHYHTQGCEVSPYEGAINGPSSPTFLCTSCLPFLFHPFRGLDRSLKSMYKTVNLMNGNHIPILLSQRRSSSTHAMIWGAPSRSHQGWL